MGNMIPAEVVYDEVPFVVRPASVWSRTQLVTGTIREMHFWAENVTTGTFTFNVRKSNAKLFDNSDAFSVNVGQLSVSKTGLSIPATRGEVISLDLVLRGSGRVLTPIMFLWITEEV